MRVKSEQKEEPTGGLLTAPKTQRFEVLAWPYQRLVLGTRKLKYSIGYFHLLGGKRLPYHDFAAQVCNMLMILGSALSPRSASIECRRILTPFSEIVFGRHLRLLGGPGCRRRVGGILIGFE